MQTLPSLCRNFRTRWKFVLQPAADQRHNSLPQGQLGLLPSLEGVGTLLAQLSEVHEAAGWEKGSFSTS